MGVALAEVAEASTAKQMLGHCQMDIREEVLVLCLADCVVRLICGCFVKDKHPLAKPIRQTEQLSHCHCKRR